MATTTQIRRIIVCPDSGLVETICDCGGHRPVRNFYINAS